MPCHAAGRSLAVDARKEQPEARDQGWLGNSDQSLPDVQNVANFCAQSDPSARLKTAAERRACMGADRAWRRRASGAALGDGFRRDAGPGRFQTTRARRGPAASLAAAAPWLHELDPPPWACLLHLGQAGLLWKVVAAGRLGEPPSGQSPKGLKGGQPLRCPEPSAGFSAVGIPHLSHNTGREQRFDFIQPCMRESGHTGDGRTHHPKTDVQHPTKKWLRPKRLLSTNTRLASTSSLSPA